MSFGWCERLIVLCQHHWTCLFVVQARKSPNVTDIVSRLQNFKSSTAGPVPILRASYLQ